MFNYLGCYEFPSMHVRPFYCLFHSILQFFVFLNPTDKIIKLIINIKVYMYNFQISPLTPNLLQKNHHFRPWRLQLATVCSNRSPNAYNFLCAMETKFLLQHNVVWQIQLEVSTCAKAKFCINFTRKLFSFSFV